MANKKCASEHVSVFPQQSSVDPSSELLINYQFGGIGTALFFLLYQQMLTWTIVGGSQSAAWTLSYLLSIIWQHLLHRHLVFGATSPYLSSLLYTYGSYGVSLAVSPFIMMIFETIGINESVAWALNLLVTGVINYFMLSKAMGSKPE